MLRILLRLPLVCAFCSAASFAADDILIADFEGETYGDWKVEGEAFGPGPAKGTFGGQMHVSGYKGERLVNTFYDVDQTTGALTSPPFKVERGYLTFLIGGDGDPKKTCINLIHDEKVVRTAVGPNTDSGGSEALELPFWDVRELKGESVTIQIDDQTTGGWGHINIDHIVPTDEKPNVPDYRRPEKTFTRRAAGEV